MDNINLCDSSLKSTTAICDDVAVVLGVEFAEKVKMTTAEVIAETAQAASNVVVDLFIETSKFDKVGH